MAIFDDKQTYSFYCGIFTLFVAVVLLVAQFVYLARVCRRKKTFRAEFSIVLLCMISICDIMMLLSQLAAGIQMIVWKPKIPLIAIFGTMVTCSWNCSIFTLCFMSMHRCIWIVFPVKAQKLLPPLILKIFLLFLCLYVPYHVFITQFFPFFYIIYMPEHSIWNVVGNSSFWAKQQILLLNQITNYLIVCFNAPFYLGITIVLLTRPKAFRTASDIFVLVQMFAFWGFGAATWILWELFPYSSEYILQYLNSVALWLMWNGLQPITAAIQFTFRRLQRKRAICVSGSHHGTNHNSNQSGHSHHGATPWAHPNHHRLSAPT